MRVIRLMRRACLFAALGSVVASAADVPHADTPATPPATLNDTVQTAVLGTLKNASVDAMQDATIVLRISKEFIRQHAPAPIEQSAPVRRCLLGAEVRGSSHTSGRPSITIDEPSEQHKNEPVFTLHFVGTTTTHTVATKGVVVTHNTGHGSFDVHREIRFDGVEFSDGPETAECVYTSSLGKLCVPPGVRGRIVRKLALPQIASTKPSADAIALREMKAALLKAFDAPSNRLVQDLNTNVPWKQTLAILSPDRPDWTGQFSSTEQWVEARSTHASNPSPDIPAEAAALKAPIELWVQGKPDATISGKLVALWSLSHGALDRFREVAATPPVKTAAGIEPRIVGDWWVIRVGSDVAERFLDGMKKAPNN